MRVAAAVVLSLATAALVLGASAKRAEGQGQAADGGAAQEAPGDAGAVPACVQVATQAIYVPFGYNHVVVLRNGCNRVASCSVATNVSPTAHTVEVQAGTQVEVLTFMASPSSTFTALVSCTLR